MKDTVTLIAEAMPFQDLMGQVVLGWLLRRALPLVRGKASTIMAGDKTALEVTL